MSIDICLYMFVYRNAYCTLRIRIDYFSVDSFQLELNMDFQIKIVHSLCVELMQFIRTYCQFHSLSVSLAPSNTKKLPSR